MNKDVFSWYLKQSVLLGPAPRTPDGLKYWAGNAVQQVDSGWQNVDATACQHWRPGCSAPTDTVVRGRSDTGELSLQAWREPGRERRANAVSHAVSDQGHCLTYSSVQHPLSFVRYCPWCTGRDGVTVIHSRVNDSIDERGQRVRVQRPPDMPELTKSVKAARADTRDVTIDAQIQQNVHAGLTNVAAGDGSISTSFQHRITTFHCSTAVTWAGEQQFCLVHVDLQSVGTC